jgi:hypothetical protein
MNKEKTYWSLDLAVDLYECNSSKFSMEGIKIFAKGLGELIDEGRWVTTEVSSFGEGEELMEGFRLVSQTFACLVTAHFVKSTKKAYINIHSCNPYRPTEAIEFCGDFFETTKYGCRKNLRD